MRMEEKKLEGIFNIYSYVLESTIMILVGGYFLMSFFKGFIVNIWVLRVSMLLLIFYTLEKWEFKTIIKRKKTTKT